MTVVTAFLKAHAKLVIAVVGVAATILTPQELSIVTGVLTAAGVYGVSNSE